MAGESDITLLLARAREGDEGAGGRAFELLYQEMRRMARSYLRGEAQNHSLQPTALVNEAYLRLFAGRVPSFQNRSHFLAMAARVMRRLLVDHARLKQADKRGGGVQNIDLDENLSIADEDWPKLLILNDALDRLEKWDARQCQIVEMRFFGGLSELEIANALSISLRTVKREWEHARAWLHGELCNFEAVRDQP